MESSRAERAAWLVLRRIPQVGPVHFLRLVRVFGTAEAVLQQSSDSLRQAGFSPRIIQGILQGSQDDNRWKEAEAELERAAQDGCRILLHSDPDYPVNLRGIYAPPPYIYIRGTIEPRDRMAVAVVGSRKAGRDGIQMAGEIATGLSRRGITVVSGFARGIDSAAHRGAVDAGGRTLAVFGNGLRHCYPPENREMFEKVPEHGALISELPLDTPPEPRNFPPRNRIIAGLGLAVLVVEAPVKSGALITAHFAREQNRDVFAIPGRVPGGRSGGCHQLIKDGALLVENEWDILAALEREMERISDEIGLAEETPVPAVQPEVKAEIADLPLLRAAQPKPQLSGDEAKLWDFLTDSPTHIDHLSRRSGMEISKVARILLGLQLKQLVRQAAGMQFYRAALN